MRGPSGARTRRTAGGVTETPQCASCARGASLPTNRAAAPREWAFVCSPVPYQGSLQPACTCAERCMPPTANVLRAAFQHVGFSTPHPVPPPNALSAALQTAATATAQLPAWNAWGPTQSTQPRSSVWHVPRAAPAAARVWTRAMHAIGGGCQPLPTEHAPASC